MGSNEGGKSCNNCSWWSESVHKSSSIVSQDFKVWIKGGISVSIGAWNSDISLNLLLRVSGLFSTIVNGITENNFDFGIWSHHNRSNSGSCIIGIEDILPSSNIEQYSSSIIEWWINVAVFNFPSVVKYFGDISHRHENVSGSSGKSWDFSW